MVPLKQIDNALSGLPTPELNGHTIPSVFYEIFKLNSMDGLPKPEVKVTSQEPRSTLAL
jgi:hypothetical protein